MKSMIITLAAAVFLSGCATTGGEYFSCNLNASAVLTGDYNNARVSCNANKTIRRAVN